MYIYIYVYIYICVCVYLYKDILSMNVSEATAHSLNIFTTLSTTSQVEGAWPKALALMKGDHPSNQAVSVPRLNLPCHRIGLTVSFNEV